MPLVLTVSRRAFIGLRVCSAARVTAPIAVEHKRMANNPQEAPAMDAPGRC